MHSPCTCGSSDGRAVYRKPNGTIDSYCWSCVTYFKPSDTPESGIIQAETASEAHMNKETVGDISTYPFKELIDRAISKEVAEYYGVRVGFDEGSGEVEYHYYPYYRDGQLVAYKSRDVADKKFNAIGSMKGGTELFGQQLISGGKMVVVTEGECDAMSAYQLFRAKGKNYKVVSLPSGANTTGIKHNLEWLETFQTVVLCFDNDKAGQKAAKCAAELLSPGKAKIMTLPMKDPNDMLQHGKANEFLQALMSAKEMHPAGIVSGADTWDLMINKPTNRGIPYPWDGLNDKMYGMRLGDLDTITSGSGMGKTQLVRELEYHLVTTTDASVGVLALEEPVADSVEALAGLHINKRINLPDVRDECTEEELRAGWEATSGTNRIHYFDHFGSLEEDGLISKIRYLAKGLDCKYIILDHLSIVISEFADQGGERERIDAVMTRLKSLTQELNIWIGLIVHLRKTSGGTSFEEGAVPSLDDLRGSGAIKQLSNGVITIARNQQHPDKKTRNTSEIHVLKCRLTGRTGPAGLLEFNEETGRMVETEADEFSEDEEF